MQTDSAARLETGLVAHTTSGEEACRVLATDPASGLESADAARRLAAGGPNALPEQPGRTVLEAAGEQFANVLILLLLAATVLAAAVGEWVDAATIGTIIALSAALGLAQEWRAERALHALRRLMAPTARVVRDGRVHELLSGVLVPGDIVLLEVGHYVPADVRLLETARLEVDESALTGESRPVRKDHTNLLPPETPVADRDNCAFAGTIVTYGRGRAVVVATGARSEVGRIAALIGAQEEERTPLQRRMSGLGRWLGLAAVAASAGVFAVGTATGGGLLDMLLTAISLAVAAVPEGLPAVVTIGLALGMQRMARSHALVRRLSAVETLGSATVIASDKTGTLTRGEMTVECLSLGPGITPVDVTGGGYEPRGGFMRAGELIAPASDQHLALLLAAGALCNDARLQEHEGRWTVVGDTTEGALVVAAEKAGLSREELERAQPREGEVPFSSERARMTTIHRREGQLVAYMKGAPDVVLALCSGRQADGELVPMAEVDRDSILAENSEMAGRGLRVLAVAYRRITDDAPHEHVERELTFLGLVAMRDPPREEARAAVASCREAGIMPVMITGDHVATALAIARDLGIAGSDGGALSGVEVERLDDGELREALRRVTVFARISPEQKTRIVRALRADGHIVAVTGDGVNDAPALKQADIGVAMGLTGTDVAREASDMVITDDNFASIVAAVEEGRRIFDNIRAFVVLLLSANIGEIILIFGGVVVGLPLPLVAAQILLVNLLTDGLPAIALVMEQGDPDEMRRPPRPPAEPVLRADMARQAAVRGVIEGAGALAVFAVWLQGFDSSHEAARSAALATVVICELLEAHASRSLYRPLAGIGVFRNRYLWGATALSLAGVLAALYVPPLQDAFRTEGPDAGMWAAALAVGAVRTAVIEAMKISPCRLRR